MDGKNTQRFINVLQDVVNSYNNRVHRMIGMTPATAELKENHLKIRRRMDNHHTKFKHKKPKYEKGDKVRITTFPEKFQRGFEVQNKNEVFMISRVNTRLPLPLYKLHTYGQPEDIIKGSFYEHELTPTDLKKFYVEKVIRKTKDKALVKWEGYSEPTWEPRKYIENILKSSNGNK